nr:hypothetical protein [Tanacetum cinerariifolium]
MDAFVVSSLSALLIGLFLVPYLASVSSSASFTGISVSVPLVPPSAVISSLSFLYSSPLVKDIEFTFLVMGDLSSSLINSFSGALLVDIVVKFCVPSRWKELSKEMSSKILLCGDGSCWKTFKPVASLMAKGKLK